jgi:hypothetical protein
VNLVSLLVFAVDVDVHISLVKARLALLAVFLFTRLPFFLL